MNLEELDITIAAYKRTIFRLLDGPAIYFSDSRLQSTLPESGGIYAVFQHTRKNSDELLYIGKSIKLRQRIYKNHLMGSRGQSTLRNKMINSGLVGSNDAVRPFLRINCFVKLVEIADEIDRKATEHF